VTETGVSIIETSTAKATVSGSTAKCTVNIPYSWPLASPSTDTIGLSYGIGVTGTRITSKTLPRIKVPANGAITTEAISATI
jgi:hypothetical protein